jgi:branched-subunit amino acid aminotransferase/4-amino-4-deoxychorismate lyase
MPRKVLFNNELVNESDIRLHDIRRGFLFGDGVFETIRVHDNRVVFKEYHLNRLQQALSKLGLRKGTLDPDQLEAHVGKLTGAYDAGSVRVRLVVYRTGSGNYRSGSDEYSWLAEAEVLDSMEYPGVESGLNLGTSREAVVFKHSMSGFKTLSAIPYVIAGRECANRGFDDLVITDPGGHPSEAISSNIYFLNGSELLTPGLDSGCVEGVIRSVISDRIHELGYSLRTCTMTPKMIGNCSSMYLTNSVSGIQWVANFDGTTFKEGPYKRILNFLNEIS